MFIEKKNTIILLKHIYGIIGIEYNNMTIINITFYKIDNFPFYTLIKTKFIIFKNHQ